MMRVGLSTRQATLTAAGILYVVGVWLHFPHGGDHIYSDIPTIFQLRECAGGCLGIPYVTNFIEYPVLVDYFIYTMAVVGLALPINPVVGYYLASVTVLAIPSLLLVDESMKLARLVGTDQLRVMRYLVVTPTFIFILLVNWYAIGVYFMLLGLRMYLEGKSTLSGVLFGLSAASNMITAAPAIGLLVSVRSVRDAVKLAGGALGAFLALNAPFIVTNWQLWDLYWQWQSGWYIEDSWMRLFLDIFSPLRHEVAIGSGVILLGSVFVLSRVRSCEPLTLAWLSAFAVLFSSYVFTPQMNLMILPFLALAPIVGRYWEFLVFDLLAAAIIVVGFSQPLEIVGITFNVGDPLAGSSIIVWIGIVRSLWVLKFLSWNGIRGTLSREPGLVKAGAFQRPEPPGPAPSSPT